MTLLGQIAYEGEYDEGDFKLYPEDLLAGLQHEGPPSHRKGRKAKRNNSKVASQLGRAHPPWHRRVLYERGRMDDVGLGLEVARRAESLPQHIQRRKHRRASKPLRGRSTFAPATRRSSAREMTKVEDAKIPLVCLSDCRSLFDHLHRQGVPRTPSDRRLAVDLAALRQALRAEKWSDKLPLAWIPSRIQLGDVLTKPSRHHELVGVNHQASFPADFSGGTPC